MTVGMAEELLAVRNALAAHGSSRDAAGRMIWYREAEMSSKEILGSMLTSRRRLCGNRQRGDDENHRL
jgi:hypothetical protein